jgi:hypothetical protein
MCYLVLPFARIGILVLIRCAFGHRMFSQFSGRLAWPGVVTLLVFF